MKFSGPGDVFDFATTNPHSRLYHDFAPGPESTMTIEEIRATQPLSHYPEADVRYLVSEFDPRNADTLVLLPQRIKEKWQTLDATLAVSSPHVAMLAVPVFWQLGPFFYHTCRKRRVPVSVVTPRNLPLACEIISQTNVELVVTTPEIAQSLNRELLSRRLERQIRDWHLIISGVERPEVPELFGNVRVEIHVFPGFPVASARYSGSSSKFAPYPEYSFTREGGMLLVSSLEKHALPFIRLRIPEYMAHVLGEDVLS